MIFEFKEKIKDGNHYWAVAYSKCDLNDDDDELVKQTVDTVRLSYGENHILELAQELFSDIIEDGDFDITHLINTIREGMPDPEVEVSKKPHLTNYRSESVEMVAKNALSSAYGVEYPTSAQMAKQNANQPILGFDGWGVYLDIDGSYVLVLIQVKGTDQGKTPPSEALKLALECKRVPQERSKIIRALSSMVILLSNNIIRTALVKMLLELSQGKLPRMYISPVIVRGKSLAQIEDLRPVVEVAKEFSPAFGRGICLSIGTDLTEFGKTVMNKARNIV